MKTKPQALLLGVLLPAVVGGGCIAEAEDDCYRHEPTTFSLSFIEADSSTPTVGEPLNVYLQVHTKNGPTCHDQLGVCHCSLPGTGIADFAIIDARCPNEDCTVLRIGSGVSFLVDVTVVPHSETALLEVTVGPASDSPPASAYATATHVIHSAP